jgi:hypothetical protein
MPIAVPPLDLHNPVEAGPGPLDASSIAKLWK